MGAVDGTALSYDAQKPSDAPTNLDAGQVASLYRDAAHELPAAPGIQ